MLVFNPYKCVCCRANDVAVRQRYVKLVDSVKEIGGEVKIFSSLHVSGERTLLTKSMFVSTY